TDEEIRTVLAMVNLTHLEQLIFNFDAHYGVDWDKILTPGEQQKLAFARLFFWRPVFAVLLLDGKGGYSTSDIDINGCEDVSRWIDGNLRL
ncbi:22889_t:CDS:2, partial [Dentiscutata erythropus]